MVSQRFSAGWPLQSPLLADDIFAGASRKTRPKDTKICNIVGKMTSSDRIMKPSPVLKSTIVPIKVNDSGSRKKIQNGGGGRNISVVFGPP